MLTYIVAQFLLTVGVLAPGPEEAAAAPGAYGERSISI